MILSDTKIYDNKLHCPLFRPLYYFVRMYFNTWLGSAGKVLEYYFNDFSFSDN